MNKIEIKRFDVISLGLTYGAVLAALGLIIGIFYFLMLVVFGAALAGISGRSGLGAGAAGIVGGLIMVILIPIIYGVLGFIGGIITALVYNLVAGIVGGIKLEVSSDSQFMPPNPPSNWN